MKEKSILLYPHEVRGVLQGRQTRITRIIRPQPEGVFIWTASSLKECRDSANYICPYEVGMRLWVRETIRKSADTGLPVYNIDGVQVRKNGQEVLWDGQHFNPYWNYKPSIHMPRWASRLSLEVTGVRVERVQDKTEEDAELEGAPYQFMTAKSGFRALWSSIHGPSSWGENPFCWVYNIKRVEVEG